MNPLIQFKNNIVSLLLGLVFACFGLLPTAQAVVPAPDGGYPGGNTAEGQNALFSLTTGSYNTAVGWLSLRSNTTSFLNTAIGAGALAANTVTSGNTAVGAGALLVSTGFQNTATGAFTLFSNTTGGYNVAVGHAALSDNTTGSGNVALGTGAGNNATTGGNNVYIGGGMNGVAGESNTTYIRNVYDSQASARIVYVNQDNKIGTLSSSRRYKEDIKPMDNASEAIFRLNPVTFHYKAEVDRSHALSFGLIAEDVAEISPELITRDRDGKPETVRYDAVNAMLLNEFLKEHRKGEQQGRKIEEMEATVARLESALKQQSAQIQKVSAQLEASRPAPQTVLNNQ
jgi:hypothetical protein